MNQTVIFGASRGLGAELARLVCSEGQSVLGIARKEERLQSLASRYPTFHYRLADFAKPEGQEIAIRALLEATPEKVFFMAGGGPHGRFSERQWRDHAWAFEVSFLFAAKALHALATRGQFPLVVLAGSAVAESQGDALASSYAAAKHALRGLYASLRLEYPDWDLRLFSPGYMDTEMLPKGAEVRLKGVFDPAAVARELWAWARSASDKGGHRVYPMHPSC